MRMMFGFVVLFITLASSVMANTESTSDDELEQKVITTATVDDDC